MGTFRIFEELSQVMDAATARKLTEILDAMYTDLQQTVTKADFQELKSASAGLARAHTGIENRLDRLETALIQLAEAQKRTEARVEELAEAQKRTEARVEELAEAQKRTEDALRELIQRVNIHEQRLAKLDGRTLEMQFRDKASAYLGRVLRRTRVVPVGDLADELEGVLTPDEWNDLRMADVILSGRADVGGKKTDVFVVVEVSVTVEATDVERAARRAALLRKKGWKAIAVTAGDNATDELISLAAYRGVAVLRDGQEFNWPQALAAA